jgi:O-antigen/teichoic acid export membrane protein
MSRALPQRWVSRVLSREALTVVAFSASQLLLGLGATRLLTQVAAPEALGQYYLFTNLALWLTLPTSSAYLYVWKNWTVARFRGRARAFVRVMATALLWQAALCVVGSVLFEATGIMKGSWLLVAALSLAAAAQATSQTVDQVQSLERHRVLAGILGLLGTPMRQAALAIGVLFVARESGESLLLTHGLYGATVAALSVWLLTRATARPYPGEQSPSPASGVDDMVSWRRFFRFTVPFLVTALATQAATSAERWGLALRADPGSTAVFVQAVAVSVAAVGAATLPVSTYYLPILSQASAKRPEDPIAAARAPLLRFVMLSGASLALATIGVTVLAPILSSLLFGPRYRDIGSLLPWTMLGQSLFGLGQALSLVPLAVEATVAVNGVLVGSKVVYLVLLLAIPSPPDCALWFSKCFVVCNLLYLLGMSLVAFRAARRGSRSTNNAAT